MSAPVIFNGRRSKLLTADGLLTSAGRTIDYDGFQNYIANNGAEVGTTGWATYADAAQATPVNGTGGSPTVTWTRSTTTPLRGAADFNFVKDAANRQGEGVSYDFTIAPADQGRVLSISFDYETVSGTYASGDMTIWVYDVTNGVLLNQPSGNSIIYNTLPSQAGATFQTSSNSISYRFILHVTTTSASAYTLAFDNFSLTPQFLPYGSAATDLVDAGGWTITSTGGATAVIGTTSRNKVYWRREGQFAMIYYELITTGAGTAGAAGEYLIALPTGLVADTTFITLNTSGTGGAPAISGRQIQGAFDGSNITSANSQSQLQASMYDSTHFRLTGFIGGANAVWYTSSAFTLATTSFGLGGWIRIPIVGWSSNSIVSSSANTRRIAALITGDPASATVGNPIIVPTVSFDDVAGYNATTGRYTCSVPGVYKIYGALQSASTATTLTIYKNAVSTTLAGSLDSNGEATFCGSVLCNAGDIIDIRPGGTVDATNMALNIELTNGPAQIAESESINARYFASATSVTGSLATVSWTTKDYDTHNGMSAGTYTIPAPGKYQVTSALQLSGTFILNNINTMEIQKNGSVVTREAVYAGGAITQMTGFVSDVINCSAGDTLRVQVSNSGTTPAIISSNFANYISIVRVGQ